MKIQCFVAGFLSLIGTAYAQSQNQNENLTKIIAAQQVQIQSLLKAKPGKSCRDIKENYPNAQDGDYLIARAETGLPTPVYCDMKNGGWTRIAAFDGKALIIPRNYIDGLGSIGSHNYALPCSSLDLIDQGKGVTMRINMGQIRDYFRPIAGVGFCQMLTESPSRSYTWSAAADGPYIQPTYYGSLMGGSGEEWPRSQKQDRRYLSFWGLKESGVDVGGCCHNAISSPASWGQAFEVYIR